MDNSYKIYDLSFKRMFRLSGKMLIKFVNKVFEKHFPLNSEITFLDTNTVNGNGKEYEKDLYFVICGERFHIEAQSYHDDMIIRLFNYAVSDEEGYKRIDDSHAVFTMPQQAVVFLKDTDKNNDRLYIRLILPDLQEIEYSVHAVRALGYTPKELLDNDMEILLPFQIIKLYGSVNKYSSYTEEQKTEFLKKFSEMCSEIADTLHKLKEAESVTNDEFYTMIAIIQDLEKYVYSSIDDIKAKGADSMLNEEFVFWDDRIRAEEREKAEAIIAEKEAETDKKLKKIEAETNKKLEEKDRQFAAKMILNNESAEKIEEYTGLRLVDIKAIAKSLGKTLML